MNSSATTVRSSTGANSSASFTRASLNRPPDTICPREKISQNTRPPIIMSPTSM